MRALFDTNVLIWWLSDPKKIPKPLFAELIDENSIIYFSQVSLLEIQIKINLGKLALDFAAEEIPSLSEKSGLTFRPLSNEGIFTLAKLPALHRDPFDRLLIAEAIDGGMALITPDANIHRYPIKVRW